jgi:hypothetical protein
MPCSFDASFRGLCSIEGGSPNWRGQVVEFKSVCTALNQLLLLVRPTRAARYCDAREDDQISRSAKCSPYEFAGSAARLAAVACAQTHTRVHLLMISGPTALWKALFCGESCDPASRNRFARSRNRRRSVSDSGTPEAMHW